MVYTDIGKEYTAALIGGSGSVIGSVAIGTGSAAVAASRSGLTTESDRNSITSVDTSVAKESTFLADFSATEMSGTTLTEFGTAHLSSGGKLWNVEGFAGLEFDGTNELQVEIQMQTF